MTPDRSRPATCGAARQWAGFDLRCIKDPGHPGSHRANGVDWPNPEGGRRRTKPSNAKRCTWCHGEGRIIKPCPMCGGLVTGAGELVYMTGSIWDASPSPPAIREPKRRAKW